MGKKSERRLRSAPVRDWHLWTAIGRTVSPIKRRKSADPKSLLEDMAPEVPAVPVRVAGLPLAPPPLGTAPRPRPERGIEPGLGKRLARGTLPIDARLDLHGMTQDEARPALERFLVVRAARGDRTVLVITGKGLKKTGTLRIENRGVLRVVVPLWLAAPPLSALVAGFAPAHRSHGGDGALYVRLKRARP